MRRPLSPLLALASCWALSGCQPLLAGYSLDAYKNGTSLKAEVAALVAESTQDYSQHVSDVSALTLKLNEAYEFARGEPYNALSAQQWRILIDPNGALYGGFVSRWQMRGRLNETEARNERVLLDRAFDQIICLEVNKQAAAKCPSPESMVNATGS